MTTQHVPHESDEEMDHAEARHRASPGGKIVYEAAMTEAREELDRSSAALFFSSLAAGLAMGFSLLGEATLRHALPSTDWATLLTKLGYSFGFLIVMLGRQQLFTENTLTPMLPLLNDRDGKTLANVGRLWGVVLTGNLLGAAVVALVFARTPLMSESVLDHAIDIGHKAIEPEFGTILLRGIFAGWLIALLVWMLPYAESTHFFVIIAMTWLIGVLHLSHVIAGAVTVFTLARAGEAGWGQVTGGFIVPSLIGNIIGGVALVAALNHAQVNSGAE